jgi:uncharacterized protein (DUF2336 family)
MTAAYASLIPELEHALETGSPARRVDTLRRITDLFLDGADSFTEDHVDLFDNVLGRLIDEIETRALVELSHRLAPISNAPIGVVGRLAHNDDITVAGPVLQRSPRLGDDVLVDVAQSKSQAHLLAISSRQSVAQLVTDVLVRRGDRDVARSIAGNDKASFSENGFAALVKRAENDGELAEKIGRRADIPPHLFRAMLVRATEVVQQRLLAVAHPEIRDEIQRVLAKVADEVKAQGPKPRDFSSAQRTVIALRNAGELDEAQLLKFAEAAQYDEVVTALSELCAVSTTAIDRFMHGQRPDPVLILGKAAGFAWPTVRAVMMVRPSGNMKQPPGLETAQMNFERLAPATAQRVVRFWQLRQEAD